VKDKSDAASGILNPKSLDRNKSRSSNNLAGSKIPELMNDYESNALDGSHQDQLRRLLDGFLSPDDGTVTNGTRPATAISGSKGPMGRSSSKRQVSGGLGRPPY
jgi:hypothetical protein